MGVLRLLLASVVLIHHAPFAGDVRPMNGGHAVEIFFMLSGFYMALVLDDKYSSSSWSGISTFYLSRFFRLWPSFVATTLVFHARWLFHYIRLGHAPMSAGPLFEWAEPWFVALVRFSNVFMIGSDLPQLFHINSGGVRLTFGPPAALPDGSLSAGGMRVIGQGWSIGTEIWFYLLAPFLLRARTSVLITVTAAALLLRFYMQEALDLTVYFFFPTQLPLFVAGAIAYRLRATLRSHVPALLPLATIIAWFTLVLATHGQTYRHLEWLMYLLICAGLPSLFERTKAWTFDRMLGELSYPVYIVHMLVIALIAPLARALGLDVTAPLVLSLVLPIAYAMHRYLEQPVDRWRQQFVARRNAAAARLGVAFPRAVPDHER